MENKEDLKINKKNVNDLVSTLKKIANIFYILIIIFVIYGGLILLKEIGILSFLGTILKVLMPLFIGILIAWLFSPTVKFFMKKKLNRFFSVIIVYAILLGIIGLVLGMLIPTLSDQVKDFVNIIPTAFETVKGWFDGVFDTLSKIDGFDITGVRDNIFKSIETYGTNLVSTLPTTIFTTVSSLLSAVGVFLLGLIIGFYILISYENVIDVFEFLPNKIRKDAKNVVTVVDSSLRKFLRGILIDASLLFVVSAIAFWLVGLKAPLLFALFCAITNIIPFIGPYIGGVPAVIVAFSQSTTLGIAVLITIVVIQLIESNLLQPIIMSRSTKLHPVTIMIGLLVMGYFFGIFGMLISTPVITIIKSIYMYFSEKYKFDFLNFIK